MHPDTMSTPLSKRQIFNYFRMGLVTGLVDKPTLIAWADRRIMEEEVPDDRVIELALASRRSYSELIWLLRGFQGEPDHDLPLRLVLARAGVVLEAGAASAEHVIMGLRLLNEEEYLPVAVRHQIAGLRQNLEMCRGGELSRQELHALLAGFLDPYRDGRALLGQLEP